MIKTIVIFTVICDNCGKDVCDTDQYSGWDDIDYMEQVAQEDNWLQQDDKHYCQECYSYDDEDNLIIKQII
jgi:hypothetical protein